MSNKLPIYYPAKVLLYMKELQEKTPVFLEVHPANICNHQCVWCRYPHEGSVLSLNFMLDLFERFPKVKGIRITGGGEPLINKNIFDFTEECGKRGIQTGIETNGSLLNNRGISVIGNNCRYCRISLDAATAETHALLHRSNDFHKIIANIKLLRETNLPELGISYLVTKDNVEEIPLLADLELPINYIHFKPLIQGIKDLTREKALERISSLEREVNYPIKYNRIIHDDFCNKKVKCRIATLIRVIGANEREYVCCEHAYEEEFEVENWDGSNSKCVSCRYNPYNELIDLYERNAFTKEFL